MNGDMLEAILMQNNRRGDGHVWNWGPGSSGVISIFYSYMHASIVILISKYCATMVEIPSLP